jgi:hypothetical protein
MRRSIPQSIFALLAAPVLFFATSASAAPSADACGNIALVATGSCHLDVTGGCSAKCEPLTFQAACDGKCDVAIDATCTASCNTSCQADCTVDPGSFDCEGKCETDCGGSCMSRCSANSDQATCATYCQESCKSTCQGQCKVVPPSADCNAKCNGCCGGSCTVDANFDCSLKCTADLKGGCTADCTAPDGALFCTDQNGRDQYVHVTNLADCEAYIASNFNVKVEASASGTCDVNGCTGVGTAGVGCSTQPVGSAPLDVGAIATMAMGLGFIVSRRRRS